MTNNLMRVRTVHSQLAISRSFLYMLIKQGLFPKPFRIGERAVAFASDEVEQIQKARMAGLSDTEIRKLVTKIEAFREFSR